MSEITKKLVGTIGEFSLEQVELIKATVAKKATDLELQLFLYQAKKSGLDPMAKQIHFVKRRVWNKETKSYDEVGTIQTGIDGYRLIADRTGNYAPGNERFDYLPNTNAVRKAYVTVKKYVQNTWHEFEGVASWDEYVQLSKDKDTNQLVPNKMWAQFPETMLAKCAEAKALRRAFPADLSGIYIHEEMMQADSEVAPAAPQEAPRGDDIPENFYGPNGNQNVVYQKLPKEHQMIWDQITDWLVKTCHAKAIDMMDALEMLSEYWKDGVKQRAGAREPQFLRFTKTTPNAKATQAEMVLVNMKKIPDHDMLMEHLTRWRANR